MTNLVPVSTSKGFLLDHILTTNLSSIRDLTPNQKHVLVHLVKWGGVVRIGTQTLADGLGTSREPIGRDLRALVTKGYITRTRSSRSENYQYTVITPHIKYLNMDSPFVMSVKAVCKALDIDYTPTPKIKGEGSIESVSTDLLSPSVGIKQVCQDGSNRSKYKESINNPKESKKIIGHSPDSQATADTIDQQITPVVQGKETDEDHMQSKDVIANLNQGKSNLKKSKGKARHGTRKNTRAASMLALKTLVSILKDKDPTKAQPTINDMHMNKLANLANKLGNNGKPNWVRLVKLIAFSCRHWEDYCIAANKIYKYNPQPNLVSMTTYMALDAMEIVAKKRYTEFAKYTHTLDDGAVSTTVCTADELEHKPVTKMGKAPSKTATKNPVVNHEEPEIVCDDDDDHEPDKWDLAIAEIDAKTKKSN